jgi:Uma2 family endonuclease
MIAEPPDTQQIASLQETTNRTASATLLHGVSWRTYESLLKDYVNRSTPRLTYDRGILEIMSPLKLHEQHNRTLADIVTALAAAWDKDALSLGSTTFKREDLERGFEPDTCFYLENAAAIAALPQIDLGSGDPPPDLIIEVDLTSPSIDRMPIFASVGVPEVWRWAEGTVRIFVLMDGVYEEQTESRVLAPLSVEIVNRFLTQRAAMRLSAWMEAIEQWADQNPPLP